MAINADTASMALFCDFENIALGVRDAQYEKFDIRPVLERLLAKGSIVVKKAYCDWDRYKGFKSAMHEANFELIEIPHVRQSGKNSADIRMVVDALDLCYTKAHVDTFVIISGDSDFSPLVSKLRENAKKVIGVGVKQSCSDLLVTNCDEFIYYDDLVREREAERAAQRREREKRSPEDEQKRREKQEERKSQAVDIVHATFVDLMADSGGSERIWASVLKEVVKRRNPGFNESYYGFRSFGNLLEEAASRGLLGFGRDDKGAYVTRGQGWSALAEGEGAVEAGAEVVAVAVAGGDAASPEAVVETAPARGRGRRRPRQDGEAPAAEAPVVADAGPAATTEAEPVVPAAPQAEAAASPAPAGRARGGRGRRGRTDAAVETAVAEAPAAVAPVQAAAVVEAAAVAAPAEATAKPARARGGRRPRQESATGEAVVAVTPVEAQADKATAGGKRPAKKAADAVAKAVRQPARSRKAKPAAE